MNNNTRNIEIIINQIRERKDKFENDFLIINAVSKEEEDVTIFVFQNKIPKDKWEMFEEGISIKCVIEEGREGSNILSKILE